MFTVGEKIKVAGKIMTVKKVKPDAVLLRGWGSQKWYDIEQVKNAIEKGVDLK